MTEHSPAPARPWYREPMVWLIIGIPLFAFVAGLAMLGYAITHPDAEVHSERRPAPKVTRALAPDSETSRIA